MEPGEVPPSTHTAVNSYQLNVITKIKIFAWFKKYLLILLYTIQLCIFYEQINNIFTHHMPIRKKTITN